MSNKQGVQNKRRGLEIFVKSNKRGKSKQKGGGISKNPLISLKNEKRDIMFNIDAQS